MVKTFEAILEKLLKFCELSLAKLLVGRTLPLLEPFITLILTCSVLSRLGPLPTVGLTRACDTCHCLNKAGYTASAAFSIPRWVGSVELILNNKNYLLFTSSILELSKLSLLRLQKNNPLNLHHYLLSDLGE